MAGLAAIFTTTVLVIGVATDASGQLRPEDRPEIHEAVSEAVDRLQRPECASLVGPNARDILLSARFVVVSFGKPKLNSGGRFNVLTASVDRARNLIIINSEGPFMDPTLKVHGVTFNLGLADRQFRALLLLHEVGHLAGKFQHDGSDPDLSRSYSKQVLEACFR